MNLKDRPEDWHQEHLCMTTADAIVLAAASTVSRAACREALAIAFPSSTKAENFCLDSWGSEFFNFEMDPRC